MDPLYFIDGKPESERLSHLSHVTELIRADANLSPFAAKAHDPHTTPSDFSLQVGPQILKPKVIFLESPAWATQDDNSAKWPLMGQLQFLSLEGSLITSCHSFAPDPPSPHLSQKSPPFFAKISDRLKVTSNEWVWLLNCGYIWSSVTSSGTGLDGWGISPKCRILLCIMLEPAFARYIRDPIWLPWQVRYGWGTPVIGDNETFQCLSVTEQLMSSCDWQLPS